MSKNKKSFSKKGDFKNFKQNGPVKIHQQRKIKTEHSLWSEEQMSMLSNLKSKLSTNE